MSSCQHGAGVHHADVNCHFGLHEPFLSFLGRTRVPGMLLHCQLGHLSGGYVDCDASWCIVREAPRVRFVQLCAYLPEAGESL